ncbi:hypothetical protein K469DRAFT_715826 [Zopfia rhizophila CBS 207.26]|uniref:Transcription factor domain-containing protein n=1 Tax=Zopfia rhizophila CBS 207.26 TaxID=1314779 RepID=A0A6A6DLU0_9PEZI|nr:hypothetical protein K469DRAFT_715826 [Zopfia rhizophila CBS 207.26]
MRFPNDLDFTASGLQMNTPFDMNNTQETQAASPSCILAFQDHFTPILHYNTIRDKDIPFALVHSMAALGATFEESYAHLSLQYFTASTRYLQATGSMNQLCRSQTMVLLVEYAAWSTSNTLREWAVQQQVVARAVQQTST